LRALADRADLIEQLHACPYCSDRRNHRVTSRGRLRIVRCRGCGLIYADRRWNRAGMVAYYSEGYFTGKVHGAHQDYLAEEREKLVDFREKLRSIRRHAPGGRLLDVGCATGFSLFAAQQLGYFRRET
jgi:ribosomal protein L37AE/L43A